MKYLITILFSICAFFTQAQEQFIIEEAVRNEYEITRQDQSMFDSYVYGYDTTFVDLQVDSTIASIDTSIVDSIYTTQYRLYISDFGGFGENWTNWRDSADYIDFVNSLVSSAYTDTYRISERKFEGVKYARELNQAIGESHIGWARAKHGSGFAGDYTLKRRDDQNALQTVSVTVYGSTGGLLKDNDGTFVTAGTRLATVRYLSDNLLKITLVFDDNGNAVDLHKRRGASIWEGYENQKLIRLLK